MTTAVYTYTHNFIYYFGVRGTLKEWISLVQNNCKTLNMGNNFRAPLNAGNFLTSVSLRTLLHRVILLILFSSLFALKTFSCLFSLPRIAVSNLLASVPTKSSYLDVPSRRCLLLCRIDEDLCTKIHGVTPQETKLYPTILLFLWGSR
jgi:hypothetical protein